MITAVKIKAGHVIAAGSYTGYLIVVVTGYQSTLISVVPADR